MRRPASASSIVAALAVLPAACSTVWGFDEGSLGEWGGGPHGGMGASAGEAGTGAPGGSVHFGGGGGESAGGLGGTEQGGGGGASTAGAGGSAGGGAAPPQCNPGQSRDVGDCERCGDLIEHCGDDFQWEAAVCEGQGACETGATRASNCDPCAHQVCTASCTWSSCQLKPSSTCLYEEGTNWRYCGGDQHHWQFCLPQCVWSTACVYCEPNC